MCGFVACLSLDDSSPERIVERMLPTIVARGPDDSGQWQQGNLAFGFRRLSIIDLTSGGHQPMLSADGDICVVFNGEIYNYLEIRNELRQLGHSFRSASDTEVLLHAYQQWGEDCVQRFVGMWAFLIYDHRQRRIFGSRDRFGIKPLFLSISERRLLLASEIKAIRAGMERPASIDWDTANAFLVQGALDDTTRTFFQDIHHVAPAHAISVDVNSGAIRQWRYWQLPEERGPLADADRQFAALFDDSIRLHVRSDVPVAVHLSGGLDSTSILCRMAASRDASATDALSAICFTDPDYDESAQIQATLSQTHAKLHSLTMTPEQIWSRFPKMLAAHDEPAHTMTALVSYCLMEVTRELGIKVVLNGQGADETLAGYTSYFRPFWRELLRTGKIGELTRNVRSYSKQYGISATRLVAREVKAMIQSSLGTVSIYQALADWRHRGQLDSWFEPDMQRELSGRKPIQLAMRLHDDLTHSIYRSPLPIYLRVEDRNAMAHSIESRVPFLDHRLVELAFRLESNELLSGHWNKHLLRRAMIDRIPEEVRGRWQKFGFPTPAQRWLRGPLANSVRELLAAHLANSADVLRSKVILGDFERFCRGELDCEQKLFRVLEFLVWRAQIAA